MLNDFQKSLIEIVDLLNQYDLDAIICTEEEGRFIIRINEYMSDPGFGYDNAVLGSFIDEDERVMFIGMLRIPRHLRKSGIGTDIMNCVMEFVNRNHFFIYLDACNDSEPFWKKFGFAPMFYNFNHFRIMGYSADQWDIFWEWEDFKRTKVYQTFLADETEVYSY
ncbi:N-acetyltransferase [Anaerobacillus sp. MEB173]|uniref:GNAT family N-acetyltransferase n=1 Tax=Anaerobacillus sp. MEB173 TaxID=3383345 RepID=UPI003F8D975C